jgi:hypothetical protein
MPGAPVWSGKRKKRPAPQGPAVVLLACGHETYAEPLVKPAGHGQGGKALYQCPDGCTGLQRRQPRRKEAA